jgi:hypothetical protein
MMSKWRSRPAGIRLRAMVVQLCGPSSQRLSTSDLHAGRSTGNARDSPGEAVVTPALYMAAGDAKYAPPYMRQPADHHCGPGSGP